jgi:4-amino-4-deoxy-L-arabinose transferase
MAHSLFYPGIFLFLVSLYFFYARNNAKVSIALLGLATFFIRLYMAFLDPFLHPWDERYHALVAKNLMSHPFTPMLRLHPVFKYDYKAWCCNHIWLHKQPLFLWQMALSMKVFGINEIAIRLPSVVLGAFIPYFLYRIGFIWTRRSEIGYIAAILGAFSYYQSELTSGFITTDHNDIVFVSYVMASIWAFCEYTEKPSRKWALVTGVFSGCAILVKWLAGLLVYGGWGLYTLLKNRSQPEFSNAFRHLAWAVLATICIAAPWQIYIMYAFPDESAWEYAYNLRHFKEALGSITSGDPWYYVLNWDEQYNLYLLPFLVIGFMAMLTKFRSQWRITIPMLAMLLAVYAFFSIWVITKMLAFVYITAPIMLVLMATGVDTITHPVVKRLPGFVGIPLQFAVAGALAFASFQPWQVEINHDPSNPEWINHDENTYIYKTLDREISPDYLIINCRKFEDNELMFYQNYDVYQFWPPEPELDSLMHTGRKVACFKTTLKQKLPDFILENPDIRVIDKELK